MQMTREDKEHLVKMIQADLAGEVVEWRTDEDSNYWGKCDWSYLKEPLIHLRIRPKPRELFVNEDKDGNKFFHDTLQSARHVTGQTGNPLRRSRWFEDLNWKEGA